jgi:hypothetical protein
MPFAKRFNIFIYDDWNGIKAWSRKVIPREKLVVVDKLLELALENAVALATTRRCIPIVMV